jgi:6-phosphogluconolactonase
MLEARGHVPTGGKTPRNFAIDPTGTWLLAAGQSSNTVHVLKLDPKTGMPQPTGVSVETPKPVCVRYLAPAAR